MNMNPMTSPTTMNEFYQCVIKDFGHRLFNKYNQKEQGFDSEIIDQITRKVKQKMQKPDQLFSKALEIRHCSASNQLVIQIPNAHEHQVKKEEIQVDNNPDDDINYEDAFKEPEQQVKKEEEDNNQGIIKHEIEDLDDEKDQEDQRYKRETIQKLKNNLTVHIVGTYQPRSKKHVAKDESTKLELDNVFIKYKNKNEEIYVYKMICDFKKQ